MTRDLFNEPLRRRELLQGGAGVALALGLAGCGVGDEASKPAKKQTERVVKAEPDGDLVYFNWSEYMEPKLIKAFEKRYGVKVRESNFDSMQGMMAKLRSGNRYDVIFPTSEWVDRLRKANQLLRIDRAQLPNSDTVYDYFAKPWYDPAADHTVPYAMYATGIIYRTDKVETSGSWNDIGLEEAKGRSYMLDDFQEVIGAGNLVNGATSTRPTRRRSRRPSSGRSASSPSCAASPPTTCRTWSTATPGSTTAGTATWSTSATRSRSPRTTPS